MLRASAICEAAGIPTSSLVSEGFVSQAKATRIGLGLSALPWAVIPRHPAVQTPEELQGNVLNVTLADVISNLTENPAPSAIADEPGRDDIVGRGGLTEINRLFIEKEWSDGLPIIPPTRDRVEEFLRCTSRSPDEVLGVLLPDNRSATVWSVAVNGVMAGCRPEYMPILLALIEAMADPRYGVEHSGNTPGGETLIILNGPMIKEFGFN